MTDGTCRRKFGRVAYGIGFAFVVAGIALYQSALRHHVPTLTIGDGWYDWGQGLGAAAFGALSGDRKSVV